MDHFKLIQCAILFISLFSLSTALKCEREVFGVSIPMNCPQPGDDFDAVYCCGHGSNKFCCKDLFTLDDEDIEWIAESIPKIIGIVAGVIFLIIILCIVFCCVCPFCILAKKRNSRGAVHQPAQNDRTVMQPLQQAPPTNAYPTQPAYPQQGYPPQQAYPAPGYPAQPYAQGPPQMQPYQQPPYPQSPPSGDQPPAYSEKPPAFNPNFQNP